MNWLVNWYGYLPLYCIIQTCRCWCYKLCNMQTIYTFVWFIPTTLPRKTSLVHHTVQIYTLYHTYGCWLPPYTWSCLQLSWMDKPPSSWISGAAILWQLSPKHPLKTNFRINASIQGCFSIFFLMQCEDFDNVFPLKYQQIPLK